MVTHALGCSSQGGLGPSSSECLPALPAWPDLMTTWARLFLQKAREQDKGKCLAGRCSQRGLIRPFLGFPVLSSLHQNKCLQMALRFPVDITFWIQTALAFLIFLRMISG